MTNQDYIKQAIKTLSPDTVPWTRFVQQLEHGATGLITEAGELLSVVKAHIHYKKPLDVFTLKNIYEEIGDAMWFIALLCHTLSFDLDDIMFDNIEKLKKRYPDKFKQIDAIERDTVSELSHVQVPLNTIIKNCNICNVPPLIGRMNTKIWFYCTQCSKSSPDGIDEDVAASNWNGMIEDAEKNK